MDSVDVVNKLKQSGMLDILDSLNFYFFIKDTNNNFLWVNRSLSAAIGKPQDQLQNKSSQDVFENCSVTEEVNIDNYSLADIKVINTKRAVCDIIESFPTLKGTRWAQTSKIPFFDENQNVVAVIGIAVDITNQRTVNMEFELLLDSLNDTLLITDYSGKILKVYRGKTGLVNDYNELIGKNIHTIFSEPSFAISLEEVISDILRDKNNNNISENGYYFEFSTKEKQFEITTDLFNHSKLVFSIRDISLRKKLDKFDHLLEEVRSVNNSLIRSLISE